MASVYKDVCETEDFLSHIDADQYSSLLSRDDLSAPSETFVFKSVMQWIKHKKEDRMAVAAKVIGAVRLGLVDIRDVIEELDAEEMHQVPEIHMLLHESLLHNNRQLKRSKGPVIIYVGGVGGGEFMGWARPILFREKGWAKREFHDD